ncbi:MAG: DUF1573 domain-containing protein [Muribaculaceae bacterium]|nr:DUF1573 domain-containing protein [Muribaculaceae bacterium]
MKKFLSTTLMVLLVAVVAMAAGKSAITFSETSHDFGNIKAGGGPVTCEYKFTNTGDAPLVILTVTNGGCGCTTPDFPKEPIAPGKTGVIKIHFNPQGRSGEFRRQVSVKVNNGTKAKLNFTGVIVP